jgi:multiple sugar transport system substrate-binding protein
VAPYVVEYNRDLFDAGQEYPALDWTWDDFVAAAVALTGGQGEARRYGFVSDAYEPNDLLVFVESLGARLVDLSVDPPAFSLDHPATAEAVRRYTSLTTEYRVKPVLATGPAEAMNLSSPYLERKALIASGRAAMWTTPAVAMPAWDERDELDVGLAPLPTGPQGTRAAVCPPAATSFRPEPRIRKPAGYGSPFSPASRRRRRDFRRAGPWPSRTSISAWWAPSGPPPTWPASSP